MVDLVTSKGKGNDFYWIKYIKNRISQNKNFMCLITGQTGSGKSWSALAICELLNDDFNIGRVVFKGKDLMMLINSEDFNNRKGVAILWDEAGIDLSNRSWQSMTNRLLNFLLQTFRHRCFVLIFTTPYNSFIDKSTRKLFHAELSTVSINFKDSTVRIKPKLIQYNARYDKFYHKWLRVATGKGAVPLKEWNIPKPSPKILEGYEIKKTDFTRQLNENIGIELELLDKDKRKPLTDFQSSIEQCWKEGIFLQREISEKLGKPQPTIAVNEKYLRNKGYYKEKYKGITGTSPK